MNAEILSATLTLFSIAVGAFVLWGAGLALGYCVLGRSSDYSTDSWSELAEGMFVAGCVVGPLIGNFTFWGGAVTAVWAFCGGTYLGIGWAERKFKTTTHTRSLPNLSVLVVALCLAALTYGWLCDGEADVRLFKRPFWVMLGSAQIWIAAVTSIVAERMARAQTKKQQAV